MPGRRPCDAGCRGVTRGSLSPQALYVCLPALLEGSPFQTERRGSWCSAPPLPEELCRVVSVYQATLDLLGQSQVHPEIAAQVLAYLLFFSGTLLFNQLLDQGEVRAGSCRGARLLGAGAGAQGRERRGGSAGTSPRPPWTPGPGRGPGAGSPL